MLSNLGFALKRSLTWAEYHVEQTEPRSNSSSFSQRHRHASFSERFASSDIVSDSVMVGSQVEK